MIRIVRIVSLAAVVVLVAAGAWVLISDDQSKRVTAYFTGAVGLYPDSDVRILGVPVGTVEEVEPRGERVEVTMTVDGEVDVPNGANALIVTPSLVSDRYVQLAPAYNGGPKMKDGAVIDVDRTVVPVEIDELFSSMNDLTTALGPDGANADGALSEVLAKAAQTLDGNGEQLGTTIRELGKAARTLSGSEKDLFGTVDNLQKFTTTLAKGDDDVREFSKLLDSVTAVFADERKNFGSAMKHLTSALSKVESFVKDNRKAFKSNVDKMAEVAKVVATQRKSLAEALNEAPEALGNLLEAYDPLAKSIDSRVNINEFSTRSASGGPALPLSLNGGR